MINVYFDNFRGINVLTISRLSRISFRINVLSLDIGNKNRLSAINDS